MAKISLITVFCACLIVVSADPERSRNYLKHDRTVINCARYSREANQHSCVLSPFNTEGPYFLPDDWQRSDITDGQVGIPYELTLNLVNSNDCTPLSGMYVHIWHASATGEYSGVGALGPLPEGFDPSGGFGGQGGFGGFGGFGDFGGFGQGMGGMGQPGMGQPGMGQPGMGQPGMGGMGQPGMDGMGQPGMGGMGQPGNMGDMSQGGGLFMGRPTAVNDERYLRGYQISDSNGQVTFKTILPGWYEGRCLHIHLEVYPKNTTESTDISYVGQIFMPSDLPETLKLIDPYSTNTVTVTKNEVDWVYANGGEETLANLESVDGTGYKSEMTFGINPDA